MNKFTVGDVLKGHGHGVEGIIREITEVRDTGTLEGDTMTKDEAKEILSKCDGWIGDTNYGTVCLDGYFTKEQLQALIVAGFEDEKETT